jgi:hypothetical protein
MPTRIATILSRPWLLPTFLAVILFAVYWWTLLPGPGYHGDTAKFEFVGYTLGTPHETGYPTYIALNYVFTHLFPFGSIAYRANLLSAVYAILCCLVLFNLQRLLGIDRWFAFIATLCFGLAATFWSQAVIAEVYSLNALFFVAVTFLFIRWHLHRQTRDFYAACAVYAISFGNHLTMITALPAIIFVVWVTDRRAFVDPRKIIGVLALIALGAAQYLYVFWRYYAPETSYLEMQTPDFASFWFSVTGGHFKSRILGYPLSWVFYYRVPLFAEFVVKEFLYLLPFPLVGIVLFRLSKVNVFLLLLMAGNLLFALTYSIIDIFVYLIPTYLIMTVYLGEGLQAVFAFAQKKRLRIPAAVLAVFPVVFFWTNIQYNSFNTDVKENAEVVSLLHTVDRDAVIIMWDYHYAMMLYYYVLCEGWNERNIHIAYYHEDFPLRGIAQYVLSDRPFRVTVTRENVPPGLTAYYFSESFKDYYNPPEKRALLRQGAQNILSQLEQDGVSAQEVQQYLYRLIPKSRD